MKDVFISPSLSSKQLFSFVAGCHLIIWDVSHKTISSLLFSLLLSNNSVRPFYLRCFSSSLEVEDVVFFFVLLFRRSNFYSFVLGALWCCFFSTHLLVLVKIMFFPLLIHLTRVLCPLLMFFSSYLVLHLFSTEVLSEFVLPCSSFLSNCFFFNFSHLRGIIPFKLFNFSRFFGFTRLSKKQLSFTSSLPLLFPSLSGLTGVLILSFSF